GHDQQGSGHRHRRPEQRSGRRAGARAVIDRRRRGRRPAGTSRRAVATRESPLRQGEVSMSRRYLMPGFGAVALVAALAAAGTADARQQSTNATNVQVGTATAITRHGPASATVIQNNAPSLSQSDIGLRRSGSQSIEARNGQVSTAIATGVSSSSSAVIGRDRSGKGVGVQTEIDAQVGGAVAGSLHGPASAAVVQGN